ncbi:leucyl, phenylalanyl-tRNA-protein transferase [Campylobacter iguaniorum]|uniref:leucyl/phenylalanyl-tRNA--protein transferase n=1 Tax=Campylobacter iguaniorum TaxID=1244531 RepID=UPI0007C8F6B4|nr:leucyl/phenylalanyl-tRNA--protein transferase [Campylobacter iguaniorum]ANE35765.1 leucyl, phenylalanyl-tRNA-protein transferase [Campylobacter iguaniorum]
MIYKFPNPKFAPKNAPLAFGGSLEPNALISAYKKGIFPWFMEGESILWWSPDPRAVFYPKDIKKHKSIKPFFKRYVVKFDHDFGSLIKLCKEHRQNHEPTWISNDIVSSYTKLHELGYAHSVEVYENDELIGGLYGLIFGKVFCGESMISTKPNASKVALITLCEVLSKFDFLIDAQVINEHLRFMGAINLKRDRFLDELNKKINQNSGFNSFKELI